MAIKDFRQPDAASGREAARKDVPFLFKAFEHRQQPPPRPGTKNFDVVGSGNGKREGECAPAFA
jgi:hypothetical protein